MTGYGSVSRPITTAGPCTITDYRRGNPTRRLPTNQWRILKTLRDARCSLLHNYIESLASSRHRYFHATSWKAGRAGKLAARAHQEIARTSGVEHTAQTQLRGEAEASAIPVAAQPKDQSSSRAEPECSTRKGPKLEEQVRHRSELGYPLRRRCTTGPSAFFQPGKHPEAR
jgi:hypothetical protein